MSTETATAAAPGLAADAPDRASRRRAAASPLERIRAVAGRLALAGIVAVSAALAVGAAGDGRTFWVPSSTHGAFRPWIAGPLRVFDLAIAPHGGALLLIALAGCYAVALLCAGALTLRRVAVAVVAAHVAFLLAPPLFSTDVFGYLSYARLDALHGFNPYTTGAAMMPHDPVFPFIAWHKLTTPYGPLFTVASLPLAWLPIPVALWTAKALAAALGLVCVALVAALARRRGVAPAPAVAFVGLNPLVLAYAVGGAHNDLLLMAVVLAGVLLACEGHAARGSGALALAAGVKVSAAIALPFLLVAAQPRRRVVAGIAAGVGATLALGYAAFGADALGFVSQIRQQQRFVARYSVPEKLANLLGFAHVPMALRLAIEAALALALAGLLWATWRRRMEWVAATGWATLAVLLATAWLLPWYVLWLLPLAAVGRDRRLQAASLGFCALVLWWNVQRLL